MFSTTLETRPTLKILSQIDHFKDQFIWEKTEKFRHTLFSGIKEELLEINYDISSLDAKIKNHFSKTKYHRIIKLFEDIKLPPIPKHPGSNQQSSNSLIQENSLETFAYSELSSGLQRAYEISSRKENGELDCKNEVFTIFRGLEAKYGTSAEFSFLVARLTIQLLKDQHLDLALAVFQSFTESVILNSDREVPSEQEKKVWVSVSQSLVSFFKTDKDSVRIANIYDCFRKLNLSDGGKLEYSLAIANAKEGDFYSARLFLVLAIVQLNFKPLPKNLNALLEYTLKDPENGLELSQAVVQYMDYLYPPTYTSKPTLDVKSFVLRTQLCSTPLHLTELIRLADKYCLLTSNGLQDEIIKRGVQLLRNVDLLAQNAHILHGWLTRLHRPRTRFVALESVPNHRPISSNAEEMCLNAFCQAGCAISATKTLSSLLNSFPSINPRRKTRLFKAVLSTILKHSQAHNFAWKQAILTWMIHHFQSEGVWKVDPMLHNHLLKSLICLNESELASSFIHTLAANCFSEELAYIPFLEKGLA